MRKKLANFIDFKFLHVCLKYIIFFKILQMVEEVKADENIELLVWKMKKSSILQNQSNFLWKQKLMYFERQNVETEPNCSQELDTFLKNHMPLKF